MTQETNYQEINSKTIDAWAADGWEWSIPISHDEYIKIKEGTWTVLLSPLKPVPQEWFAPFLVDGKLNGVKLLGLASGGAQQMPVFAALGASCTVLDNSARQLASERMVAEREAYSLDIVKADMTKPLPFEDESFDLIFHPVSNCYIEDVHHVWNECFRVLKRGGVLLAGLDNGINYLFEDEQNPLLAVNKLPFNPLKNADLYAKSIQGNEGIQFSHTIEEQIGGQLKAGFILTDLYEDRDTSVLGEYIPLFLATRAVKPKHNS